MFNVGDTLLKLATESGFAGFFANGGWQNLVMVVIACVLLYLGIVKGFEPRTSATSLVWTRSTPN